MVFDFLIHGLEYLLDISFDLLGGLEQLACVVICVIAGLLVAADLAVEHLLAREEGDVLLLDHVADLQLDPVVEGLVLVVQVHHELQLEFPVVVVLDVLLEGDALLLQRVARQLADEADVHDVVLERLVRQLQLAERVDHDAEHDLDQDDRHDQHEAHVLEELLDLHAVLDADFRGVRAREPDAVVEVERDAGQDVHAVVLGPREQPVVHVVGLREQLRVTQVHEADQRERVGDDEREHERGQQHGPVLRDGLQDDLQLVVALHQVEQVK